MKDFLYYLALGCGIIAAGVFMIALFVLSFFYFCTLLMRL